MTEPFGAERLATALQAGVALRRPFFPSRSIVETRARRSLASFFLASVTHFEKTVINCFFSFTRAMQSIAVFASNRHRQKKKTPGWVLFSFGGGDGNRTRVRKPLDITFSVGSLFFEIPRLMREQTRSKGR